MKILLTSPFMSYRDRWGQYYKGAGDTFPQGLGSIAAFLERSGHQVDVIEPDVQGMSRRDFIAYLRAGSYDLIGISAFTPNVVFAYQTADLVKSILPQIKIVLGGPHPSICPERTMRECPSLDFVIVREGEKPMLSLVEALAQKDQNYSELPNLYYRSSREILQSKTTCGWLDLDDLPIFPYHKFDMTRYTPAPSLQRVLPTFNYMAQRGCPFECAFCDTRTHGKTVRYRSVERVIEDLKELKECFKIKGVIFEGSNFSVNSRWIKRFCEAMLRERMDLSWYCMGRVDLDVSLLELMKKSGLWAMSFGIESANPKTLERMRKRISPRQVRQTITELQRLKIRSIGSFILGYPGENRTDVLNTINFACQLKLDVAVFFIPVPFPGTLLYDHAKQMDGLVKETPEWQDYSAWLDHNHPIYINPKLGRGHVRLYNYAFRRFYGRPSYILQQLKTLRNLSDIKRALRGFQSVKGLIRKGFFGSENRG